MSASAPTSIYSAFWLFRLDPLWRRLPEKQRQGDRSEFLQVLEQRDESVTLRGTYSMAGLRHDADLLLWVHGSDIDAIQRLAINLRHAALGSYLASAYTYLGVVGGGRYDPEHRPSFLKGAAPRKFLSMYPFVKTPEWYLLPYEQRRALMAEHGQLGRRYTEPRASDSPAPHSSTPGHAATAVSEPVTASYAGSVLSNTLDSYGLGDQEFIVAFESDEPAALCRMVEDLRAVEVRRYTKIDTPIFLGRYRGPAEALADL